MKHLLLIILWALVLVGCGAPQPISHAIPTDQQFEAKWGVRFTRMAVTADGGLVDVRYTVLNPGRAQAMMNSLDTTPKIQLTNGTTLELKRQMNHKGDLEAGRSYYILYVNTRGAAASGSIATLSVGGDTLGPMMLR